MLRIGIPLRRPPGRLPRGAGAFFILAAAWAAVSCIERSNPFDPINSGDAYVRTVRKQLQPRLETLSAGEDAFQAKLTQFERVFQADSEANGDQTGENGKRRAYDSSVSEANERQISANAGVPIDSAKPLQAYLLLDPLKAYGPYPEFDSTQSALLKQMANLALFMANANADNSPALIYPPAFSDSVLTPFYRDTAAYAGLRARIDGGNRTVAEYNADLQAFNAAQAKANQRVVIYNDSIAFRKETDKRPVIAQAESLSAGTTAAKAGDTLLVAEGVFTVDLRFEHSGTTQNPIVIRGYPGGKTILRAAAASSSVLVLSKNEHIRLQDVVFRGGVQIVGGSRFIEFQRCVFDSSLAYGLRVADSDVGLTDCRLTENDQGAFLQGNLDSVAIRLDNVLIARNRRHGLILNNAKGEIRNCTIADNGGDGINVTVQPAVLRIDNSIISGNGGFGVNRQRRTELTDQPAIQLCDVWGNVVNWNLPGVDSAASEAMTRPNFSIPPVFLDPGRLDYGLQPGSDLAKLENQPVPLRIGYRP